MFSNHVICTLAWAHKTHPFGYEKSMTWALQYRLQANSSLWLLLAFLKFSYSITLINVGTPISKQQNLKKNLLKDK
jgi:hypothetical protein